MNPALYPKVEPWDPNEEKIPAADTKVAPRAGVLHLRREINPAARLQQRDSPIAAPDLRHDRDQALDFTKGILVLLMVLYHWINYFISTEGFIYRYIRFITPSFIFITGFLITHIYLAKYDLGDARLQKRLLERGVKLLVLFTILNLAAGLAVARKYNGIALGVGAFAADWFSIFVTGNGGSAVFKVLVPISYVLILGAGLLWVRTRIVFPFHAACAVLAEVILMLELCGLKCGNLELIGVGLVGVFLGGVGMERMNRWIARRSLLLPGYLAYLLTVSLWDALYFIQIFGMCLSLILIYAAGSRWTAPGVVLSRTLMLGRYTLLSYIGQIAVLQILLIALRSCEPQGVRLIFSLAGTMVLTQLLAKMADSTRTRSKTMDRLYRAVFA